MNYRAKTVLTLSEGYRIIDEHLEEYREKIENFLNENKESLIARGFPLWGNYPMDGYLVLKFRHTEDTRPIPFNSGEKSKLIIKDFWCFGG